MRLAYDVPGTNPEIDLPATIELLNRESARTTVAMVTIGDASNFANPATTTVRYRNARWPNGPGTVLLSATLHPAATLAHVRQAPWYVKIAVGLRNGPRFDVLGSEYDSRTSDISEGVPFRLVTKESRIPTNSGVVVRVTYGGWPMAFYADCDVEVALGFEG